VRLGHSKNVTSQSGVSSSPTDKSFSFVAQIPTTRQIDPMAAAAFPGTLTGNYQAGLPTPQKSRRLTP